MPRSVSADAMRTQLYSCSAERIIPVLDSAERLLTATDRVAAMLLCRHTVALCCQNLLHALSRHTAGQRADEGYIRIRDL